MKKIKLECWWTNTSSLTDRVKKQFIPLGDLDEYSLVTENPDFTIVFGRTEWDKLETKKENTFYISQEPLWSPNQPKDDIHNYCSKILISDKRDYPDKNEYIETLLPMFYAGRGEFDNREEWDWSIKIKEKNFNKNKKISIIVRKDYASYYNQFENPITNKINYKDRTDLGIELSKDSRIDVFGNNWEKNNINVFGEIFNKHIGLDDYHFSVACENSIQKNYISEKFWDCVLTDTVPIYMGCININDYIPSNSFINLNGMSQESMVSTITNLIDNSDEIYNEYYKNLKHLKNEFFTNFRYNLWETIKKLVNDDYIN